MELQINQFLKFAVCMCTLKETMSSSSEAESENLEELQESTPIPRESLGKYGLQVLWNERLLQHLRQVTKIKV